MIKCKYSDIKEIYDWYQDNAGYEEMEIKGKQLTVAEFAYYTPSTANWSYKLGVIKYKNSYYKVVTVFGEIKAIAPFGVPEYK